jgi:hypothetical protein
MKEIKIKLSSATMTEEGQAQAAIQPDAQNKFKATIY